MSIDSTPQTSVSPEPPTKQTSYVFQSTVNKQLPHAVGGDGCYLIVEDAETGERRRILDGMTGAAVGALGWGDETAIELVANSVRECHYSYSPYHCNKNAEALGKFLIDNSPPGVFTSSLFLGSGSEANENAMKLVKQYFLERNLPKKNKFISRSTCYHGFTLGSLSIGANSRAKLFQDILLPKELTPKTDVCYPFRYKQKGQSDESYVEQLLDNLESLILKEGPETVAAIILETLPGSSIGTVPPPAGYLPGVRKLCNKYDIVFYLDEVMCGTGRANPPSGYGLHCWENYLSPQEAPDIQTIGKTLGSGYITIAGVLIGSKIQKAYLEGSGTVIGAHTYASHSFNCLAALKIQQYIKQLGLTKNIFKMGNLMGSKLHEALKDNPIVVDVRGIGGFWSIEFGKNGTPDNDVFPLEAKVALRIQAQAFQNGLTVMGAQGGFNQVGDHMCLAPAFIIQESDVDEIVRLTTKTVNDMAVQLKAEGYL